MKLHQGQAPALEIRSQQDGVFAGLVGFIEMEPDDAKDIVTGFIKCDKRHRARIIDLRQSSDELIREFLDGIKEAKPRIFLAHMRQQIANKVLVIRSDRPNEYSPAIPENQMPPPSRIAQSKCRHQDTKGKFYGRIRSAATRYFFA
jgi:hypothetical protein